MTTEREVATGSPAQPIEEVNAPEVDFWGADYLADPPAVCRTAREQSWFARTEYGLLVLTHGDAGELLRCPEDQMPQMDLLTMHRGNVDLSSPALRDFVDAIRLFMSPASHARIRGLCSSYFTPAAVDRWRPDMREIAEQLVTGFTRDGQCEFVADFANLYPANVFARVVGLADEEVSKFSQWSSDLGLGFTRPLDPVRERAETAITGLFAYIENLIDRRRQELGGDLISKLIEAEDDGRLSYREMRGLILALIAGGHETTKSQVCFAIVELSKHPDVWHRLASEPSVALSVVNEVIRLYPIVPEPGRQPANNVVHNGVQIRAGTPLFLSAEAANRDPAVFTDPDTFDADRPNAADHLGFGAGPHYCLGANLARAEMVEALPILARAMPNVRVLEFREMEGRHLTRRPEILRITFERQAT